MTQKTALIISVVLTAFVLVVGGGLVARVSQPEVAPAPTLAAPAATATVVTPDPETLLQREAEYRRLLDEANQRLSAMNEQLTAQAAAPAVAAAAPAPQAASQAAPQPAPQIAVVPDAARDIAVQAANFATMIRTPELVRFEGRVAYEVGFSTGVIYVDATTGAVLFNGTQGRGGQSGSSSSGGEREHEDEHEEEHEDEHHEDEREDHD